MRMARVGHRPSPVCADAPEGRYGRGSESRKIPLIQIAAVCDDHHMSGDVPSLTAPMLSQSLERENKSCFFWFLGTRFTPRRT